MLTPEELKELQEKRLAWEREMDEYDEKKEALYQKNKDKVDERRKKRDMIKPVTIMTVIAALILVAGVACAILIGGPVFIIISVVGGILLVAFPFWRIKLSKAVKELDESLKEYDEERSEGLKEWAALYRNIKEVKEQIQCHEKEVAEANKRAETERRWAEYTQNHICVSVGQSTGGIFDGKPERVASKYRFIENVTVYIDGIEYGGVAKPFGAFEVEPGSHVVKIHAYFNFGGVDKYVASRAQQVKVTDKSVFLFYHWNFYSNSRGLNDDLYLDIFDNVHDFMKHTHQN